MTLLAPPFDVETRDPSIEPTLADRRAGANTELNLAALDRSQPGIAKVLRPEDPDVRWLFARDGSLTATHGGNGGKWWGGNSLPARSARAMLKDVDAAFAVSCLVAPVHGAQVRAALDAVEPQQAVIAVLPDARAARVAIACDDLSMDIDAGRLWLVAGPEWASQLDALLAGQPGLPVPGRFIRLPDVDEAIADDVMGQCQGLFARHMAARADRIAALRQAGPRRAGCVTRVCVVAPGRFRLWSNAGRALADALAGTTPQHVAVSWRAVDTDRPAAGSPLAVATAAADCDAVAMADAARADHPTLLPTSLPWVTWVTTPRVPNFDPSGTRDRLILADPAWAAAAHEAGWPADRIAIATWPAAARRPAARGLASSPTIKPHVAFLFDLPKDPDLAPPASVEEFSSHRLLWEHVRGELTANPFALAGDVNGYLDARLTRFDIAPASFDRGSFLERLILPAHALGVAAALVGAGVPLALYGAGWDRTPFRTSAHGPVTTRQAFDAAIDAAAAVVRPWPFPFAHEADALARPVLTPSTSRDAFLSTARAALTDPRPADAAIPPLTAAHVLAVMRS